MEHGNQGQNHKGTIAVVVAGAEVIVPFNENEPLKNIVNDALRLSGNVGRKEEDWQLKFEGVLITDWSKKVGEYHFPETALLYLSLSEGVLG